MRKVFALLSAVFLIQPEMINAAGSHFSTQSISPSKIAHTPVTHSHDNSFNTKTTAPAPYISRGNPNLYNRDRVDELRYRNVNSKSRCLHLETRNTRFGTQNPDAPNMKLKFENSNLQEFNFNADQ